MASHDRAPAAPAATPGDPGETVDDRTAGEVAADATEPDAGPGDQTTRNPFTGLSEALGAAPRGGLGSAPLLDEPGVALSPGGRVATGVGSTGPSGPDVMVRVVEPSIVAGFGRRALARPMQQARARVEACYRRALSSTPGLTGDVSVRFEVADTGRVEAVAVTHADDTLVTCATSVLRRVQFPPPPSAPSIVTVRFAATITR